MAPKRPRANDAEAPAASKRKRIISGTETSADKSPIAAPKAVKTAKGKESVQPAPPKDNGKAANEPEKVLKSSKKVKSTNKGAEVPAPAEKKTSARPADEQDAIALDPADEENLRKKIKSLAPSKSDAAPGVIYLGRIPHGFYEEQMKEYFSQFGDITRLRLSRNKKTGKSKHFAFIEFRNAEVAKIVAETMDNYLLFGHLLKCHVVDPSKVHPDTFKGANRKFTKLPWEKMERERQNRTRTPEQEEQRVKRLLEKEADRRTKLAEVLGEEYEFSGYAGEIAESAGGKAKVETKKALAPEKAPTEKPKKKKLKA